MLNCNKKSDLENILTELNRSTNQLELLKKDCSCPCIRGLADSSWFDGVSAVLIFNETENSGTLIADIYEHENHPIVYFIKINEKIEEEIRQTKIYMDLIKALSEKALMKVQADYSYN